ncbi:MAG TPA: helical backbone metal receptor [Usitatibacter sp.]|nr:helical backbone metal receptor [Usitatibacter sp.]
MIRLAAAALALFAGTADAAIVLRDDLGRSVRLERPAQRIVTLAPFLTELAFSAGAGAQVVGVSAHSDFPMEARTLPQVASAVALSVESVAALRPDLVIAWQDSIRPEDVERLAPFGIVVFVAQARRLDDAPRLLEAIGQLAGTDVAKLAGDYRAALSLLRTQHQDVRRLPVLLEIWHRPLTTIAGSHWMNEALSLCGADNAFSDLPGVAPVIPWELAYARDPSVIVGAGSAPSAAVFAANWSERASLRAVKRERTVFVDADTIQRPTLRLAEGVAQLCAGLDRLR